MSAAPPHFNPWVPNFARSFAPVWKCGLIWLITTATATAAERVDYSAQIKPLLKARCYACHGALKQEGGLRLDTAELLRDGGDRGPALEPGETGAPLLVEAVRGEGGIEQMPLESHPLKADDIKLLETWIAQGASAPDSEEPMRDPAHHWAFQPIVRPSVPVPKNADWRANPIDAFLASEYEARGLQPNEPASKSVLLRRVYLDLIGLPPTRSELREFLQDESPDAYERVVERLLASPQYGERWARHWMDVWRYSDMVSYAGLIRESHPHLWRWRDWIIESVNADKPYSRMIVEMLAGDEIAPDDPDVLRATGFLARNWSRVDRDMWMDATVEHTSKAFLGLTYNCARCHDHKFDPISQLDYYRMRAFFEPLGVRIDRLAGGDWDLKKQGLSRVFDEQLTAPTYLYERGDAGQPQRDRPIEPGVPRFLGSEPLPIQAVSMPRFMEREAPQPPKMEILVYEFDRLYKRYLRELAAAKDRVQKLESELAQAETPEAERLGARIAKEQRAVAVLDDRTNWSQAELKSVKARWEADLERLRKPEASNTSKLALTAGAAERLADLRRAKLVLLLTEQAADGGSNHKSVSGNDVEPCVPEEPDKLPDLRSQVAQLQAQLDQPSAKYTSVMDPPPGESTGRRLALARWLTSSDNPLPARVAVNHLWLRHFGAPLVINVFDFGLNGDAPSHPALLDWLAAEFQESDWSMKHLHRLMVNSRAYQMESSGGPREAANRAIDRDNRLLWRMNVRRMEAETIRDSVLHVAGMLDLKRSGPDLDISQAETILRRSLYFRSSKEQCVQFMEWFDPGDSNECYRRNESVVPQQALALANSPFSLARSRRLAGELSSEAGVELDESSDADFVRLAFEQILCRDPTDDERVVCAEFLRLQTAHLGAPDALQEIAAGDRCPVPPAEAPRQRARENLVHVLINHNDFVTIR